MSTKYKEIKNLFITLNKLSMKNRVLLVLLLSFAVSLAASAQKITMNLQQVKLEKVFSLITKQTGLTVAYSRTIVNPERIVSVQAKDKDLSKVLDDLFAGTNVAYEIGVCDFLDYTALEPKCSART